MKKLLINLVLFTSFSALASSGFQKEEKKGYLTFTSFTQKIEINIDSILTALEMHEQSWTVLKYNIGEYFDVSQLLNIEILDDSKNNLINFEEVNLNNHGKMEFLTRTVIDNDVCSVEAYAGISDDGSITVTFAPFINTILKSEYVTDANEVYVNKPLQDCIGNFIRDNSLSKGNSVLLEFSGSHSNQ